MPRTVRIPLKSGVLPQPRQVVPKLKTKYEVLAEMKLRTGFSDPNMVPRGSVANPPPRLKKTADEIIRDSAKAPKPSSESTGKSLSREELWKKHMGEVRRSYLASSLKAYEAQEQKHKELREKRQAESNAESERKLTEVKDSVATMLTMPTIEQSLLSEVVVRRTPEVAAELREKREFNRKLTEHRVLETQHANLLRLYQQAASFITTEEQLEAKISALFKPVKSLPSIGTNDTQTPAWWKYVRLDLDSQVSQATQRKREDELVDAALGTVKVRDGNTVRYAPGLKMVRK